MAQNKISTQLISALSPEERQNVTWKIKVRCKECGFESEQAVPLQVSDEELEGAVEVTECPKCEKETHHEILEKGLGVMISSDSRKKIAFFVSLQDFILLSNAKLNWEDALKRNGYKVPKTGITWEIFVNTMFAEAQKWDENTLITRLQESGIVGNGGS